MVTLKCLLFQDISGCTEMPALSKHCSKRVWSNLNVCSLKILLFKDMVTLKCPDKALKETLKDCILILQFVPTNHRTAE